MKITKLFLLSLLVLFFSCSEDEDPSSSPATVEKTIGSWTLTAIDYSGTTTTSMGGGSIKATFTGKGKDIDYTTTFSADPNYVVSEGSYTIALKTTVAGQTTTEDYEFDDAFVDGTWELNGKTLTITNDDGEQEAVITNQTDTKMEVRVNVNESYSDGDITVTSKVKAIYKFEKLAL